MTLLATFARASTSTFARGAATTSDGNAVRQARFTGARRRSSRARAVMPETLEALPTSPTTAGAALGLAGAALGAAAALRGRLGGERVAAVTVTRKPTEVAERR